MVVLIMVVIIIFTERNLSRRGGGGGGSSSLVKILGFALIKTLRCFQLIHFVIITTYFLSGFRIYQARNSLN